MRIRTVKPEVHFDEALWDLEQETGLPLFRAFVGLWGVADREGRFEWRARMLKASILPYWDGDFSRVLDALKSRGFIVHYATEGREYGVVRTFTRHQVINNKERKSEIPEPTPESLLQSHSSDDSQRVDDACSTREVSAQGERKGKEGKGKEGEGNGLHDASAARPGENLPVVPETPKPPAKAKPGSKAKTEALTTATWRAYANAYQQRYGVEPARSAKASAILKAFVEEVGQADAPAIADHYLRSNYQFYLTRGHPLEMLKSDANKLRTEWMTGTSMTATRARMQDRTANNANVAQELIAELGQQGGKR